MADRGRDRKAGEAANQAAGPEAVKIIHGAIEDVGEAGEDVGNGRVDLALRIAVGELAKDMATNEGSKTRKALQLMTGPRTGRGPPLIT
jgi:hypothetical protein